MKKHRAGKLRFRNGDSTDRLSYLPDCILHRILSLVDTKIVVQTSVLSRSWRYVWKHVPALNLEVSSFDHSHKRFNTFVDKVLSLRYPTNVDEISYYNSEQNGKVLKEADGGPLVVRLVEYAVSHETQRLDLNLSAGFRERDSYKFPQSYRSIPSCSLRTLKLAHFVIDDRFKSFGFQLLTTLELKNCRFESNSKLFDPFSGFPCLQSLSIDNGDIIRTERLRIAGVQLHSLELECVNLHRSEIEIYAPKLKSFILVHCGNYPPLSSLVFPSLDHADIDYDARACDEYYESTTTKENSVLMLQAFRDVKSLALGSNAIEVLCEDFEFLDQQPSPFTRLENLTFELPMKRNNINIPYKLASYFLKASSCPSPNIKISKQYLE
ncbi:Putative F-box/LRR-repeat protein At3g18150 [Linum perenne]